ncbi:MAG: OsmC family protein [Candidatus Saccharicenans sp.]|jgi:putative redox protein|nr:OsmC family protein [Candidatus Saccharicenans sp.]MDH7493323.1 OsmC family protein [Candidatus Saccharicenans sp.]
MPGKEIIVCDWLDGVAFETGIDNHRLVLDTPLDYGGQDRGPRPKPLLLVALAGCTGMDVISMLQKMQLKVEKFRLIVEGDLTTEHPKQFYRIHLVYEFTGQDLPPEKIRQAIELSQEKYCGVSATIKKAMPLTWEFKIIDR